jgi:hypothetical protein
MADVRNWSGSVLCSTQWLLGWFRDSDNACAGYIPSVRGPVRGPTVPTALLLDRHLVFVWQLDEHHAECVHELAVGGVEDVLELGRLVQSDDPRVDVCSLDGRARVFTGQCIADQALGQLGQTTGAVVIAIVCICIFIDVLVGVLLGSVALCLFLCLCLCLCGMVLFIVGLCNT